MKTLHVNADTGLDTNPGTTPAKPLRSLQRAHNLMAAGDTCLVAQGSYAGGLRIQKPRLTFLARGRVEVTSPKVDVITIDLPGVKIVTREDEAAARALGVTLDGLVAAGAARAGFYLKNAHGSVIRNGGAERCKTQGILTSATSFAQFLDLTITDIGEQHAIYGSNGGDGCTVAGGTFERLARCGVQLNGDGDSHLAPAQGEAGDGKMRGWLISDIVIRHAGLSGTGAAINLMMAQETLVEQVTLEDCLAGSVNVGLDDVVSEANRKYYSTDNHFTGVKIIKNNRRGFSFSKGATGHIDDCDIFPTDGPCVSCDAHSSFTLGVNRMKPGGGHKELSIAGKELSLAAWQATQAAA